MRYVAGDVCYRLRFEFAPELDSDDFRSVREYFVGDELNLREGPLGENGYWQVSRIERASDGEPDTLFCDLVVRA